MIRWLLLALALLALAIGGTVAFIHHQTQHEPHLERMAVTLVMAGASPELIDQTLAAPLDRALRTVRGVRSIRTVSKEGVAFALVESEWTFADPFNPAAEVKKALERLRHDLPPDVSEASVRRLTHPDYEHHARWLIETESRPFAEASRWVERELVRALEKQQYVFAVDVCGAQKEELRITLDSQRVAALDVPLADLVRQLDLPPVDTTTLGALRADEHLDALRFGSTAARLRDFATLERAPEVPRCLAWRNGRRVIVVDVTTSGPQNLTLPALPGGLRVNPLVTPFTAQYASVAPIDEKLGAQVSSDGVVRLKQRELELLTVEAAAPAEREGLTLVSGPAPGVTVRWLGDDLDALSAEAAKGLDALRAAKPTWVGQLWPTARRVETTLTPSMRIPEVFTLSRLLVEGLHIGRTSTEDDSLDVRVVLSDGLEALPRVRLADGTPLDAVLTVEQRTATDALLRVNGQRALELRVGVTADAARKALNGFPGALVVAD